MRSPRLAIAVVAAAAIIGGGCSTDDATDPLAASPDASPTTSGTSTPLVPADSESDGTQSGTDGDAGSDDSPGATDSGSSTSLGTVETQPVEILDPVPLDEDVSFDGEVTARIVELRGVTVEGRGPGSFAGPALAVTVEFENETDERVDLSAAVVTAAYGDGTEAVASDAAPARDVRARLAPGASARGVYVFNIDPAVRDQVAFSVSYSADGPIAVLSGDARG